MSLRDVILSSFHGMIRVIGMPKKGHDHSQTSHISRVDLSWDKATICTLIKKTKYKTHTIHLPITTKSLP